MPKRPTPFCAALAACLALWSAPLAAASLCGATDAQAILDALAGRWAPEGTRSIVNEATDIRRAVPPDPITIAAEGRIASRFLDSLAGVPLPLTLLEAPAYDVDAVDDLLETTGRADLADALSDTRCGPEALPQLQATLSVEAGMRVAGTITLIAYFTDRVLHLVELDLASDETVLFLTETALLTPRTAPSDD